MRVQLLSDLHLETETFDPVPAAGAELLILAGDIDTTWQGYSRFRDWPVPVLVVAGNHEFDQRNLATAWPAFRAHCAALGLTVLEKEEHWCQDAAGRLIRIVGTTRWSDFLVFGAAERARSLRAASYFQRVMRATLDGQAPFDALAAQREGEACKDWLQRALEAPNAGPAGRSPDATMVVTHFAPSLRSADPRYGRQASTAAFCNDDEALMTRADLWLHGHVHCRHDYQVGRCRVVSQARGLANKAEALGFDAARLIDV